MGFRVRQLFRVLSVGLPLALSASGALFCWQPLVAKPESRRFSFVNSPEEYRVHMAAHRLRLLVCALELLEKFPQEFPHLTQGLVIDALSLHDQSKVTSDPETARLLHDLGSKGNVSQRLFFLLYGKSVRDLSGIEKEKAIQLIIELNFIDQKVLRAFFESRNLVDASGDLLPAGNEILRLEKIVDLVDRELDPVAAEEFGRPLDPAENFVSGPIDLKMIAHLKENYLRLTSDFQYERIKDASVLFVRPVFSLPVSPHGFNSLTSRLCRAVLLILGSKTRQ